MSLSYCIIFLRDLSCKLMIYTVWILKNNMKIYNASDANIDFKLMHSLVFNNKRKILL